MEAEIFPYAKLIELGPSYAVIAILIFLLINSVKQYEKLREIITKLVLVIEVLNLRVNDNKVTLDKIQERVQELKRGEG